MLRTPWSVNRPTNGSGNAFQNFGYRGGVWMMPSTNILRCAVSFRPCSPRVPLCLKLAELWPPKVQASGKGRQASASQGRGHGKGRGNVKGRASGRGRGSATQSPQGQSKQEWVSSAKVDGEVKTFACVIANALAARIPPCALLTCVRSSCLVSGRICLGTHPAWQHQDTPH